MSVDFSKVLSHFTIYGDFVSGERFGSGHINDTYRVIVNQAGLQVSYILQRINTNVFRNPDALMSNMSRVLDFIGKKLNGQEDASRKKLTLVSTVDGKPFYRDEENSCWRIFLFINGARTYDVLESAEYAYQAAKAFGSFQNQLAGIPGERLFETIPNFHNTPSRLADFDRALAADVCGRAASAKAEIEFVQKFRSIAPVLLDWQAKGEIPERITHNDTKINNVMLDEATKQAICVIDLDTIMPGISLYDFGDLVRTSTSPAAEDEKDLSKVYARMEMFEALAKGFLEGANGCLTPKEIELMPFSGMLITFEIGVRFITDYIEGDKYFKVHREGHNLDRCRTQFKLVQSLKDQEAEMNAIMAKLTK